METTSHAEHPRKRLTEETRLLILRDYIAGEKVAVIALTYGICHGSIANIARRRGIPRRPKARARVKPNSEPPRFGNPGSLPKEAG